MGNQSVISIEAVIDYIESHLDGKLELETVAEAVHYSKYHLHRLFTETVGMTIHDYVQRRQLTEAAKLLVFSDKPIIEIAFICGYESQQSFSLAFKAMYKSPPAEYREERSFYPLQLRFILHRRTTAMEFTIQDIRLAEKKDIVDWMNLMRLVIDGYPVMDEDDYLAKLEESIDEKRALVLREGDILIGAMAFTYSPGSIEFLGVHPQYRNRGLQKLFLDALLETYLPGQEISTTTFREQDKADTGHWQFRIFHRSLLCSAVCLLCRSYDPWGQEYKLQQSMPLSHSLSRKISLCGTTASMQQCSLLLILRLQRRQVQFLQSAH